MSTARKLFHRLWERRLPAALSAAALGIALVAVSELGEIHELRVFGATLISIGGIGLGIDAGLGSTARWPALRSLLDRRVALAIGATLLLILPILVALVAALVGVFTGSENRDTGPLVLGAVIGAFLLASSIVTGALAVRAVAAALRHEPGIGQDQQPVETP